MNLTMNLMTTTLARPLAAVLLALATGVTLAQPAGMPTAAAFLPSEPDRALAMIPLDVRGLASGAAPTTEIWETVFGGRSVRNVTRPTLTPVLPEPRKATGTAVVIAPGGAFMALAWDIEGVRVARRLADAGIAAYVLKYRLDTTPAAPAGFTQAIGQRLAGSRLSDPAAPWPVFPAEALAEQDGQAAVRWVRAHAAEHGVRPDRIGLMGFSAGGMVTMRVAAAASTDAAARPDFIAPIYGAMDFKRAMPSQAMPMFLAAAADDALLGHMALPMATAWRQAGGAVELHVYETGGHGFGARQQGAASDIWMDNFLHWLRTRGLLTAAR